MQWLRGWVGMRLIVLAAAISGGVASGGSAPPAGAVPHFRWATGQALTYKVRQRTAVQETYLDEQRRKQTRQAVNELRLTRQWTVQGVDAAGVATLQLRIVEMRSELRRDGEEPLVRDSSQAEHARELADYLQQAILTVCVDRLGRVVEVKQSRVGSAQRLEVELPFRLVLPAERWEAGQSWQRRTRVKVDPPLGVGDSYQLEQKYTLLRREGTVWTVGVSTRWLEEPPLAEQAALLPFLWQGEVYFDAEAGQYTGARLRIEQELRDWAGPGSRYGYQSSYEEERVSP